MLRPRKHPLIDQQLIAASAKSMRRFRLGVRILSLVVVAGVAVWIWMQPSVPEAITSETWWRSLITNLVSRQFQENISEAKDSRLGERVKAFEAERAEMQAKLQTLDKLVQSAKLDGWLRQFSARRETDSEISYEILLSNPHPGSAPPASGRNAQNVVVLVRGIDRFDLNAPETGVTQSALRYKTVKHELAAPRVAETLRGRVSSKAANFLIATVIPYDNPALTEVRIIPVGEATRSP